MPTILKENVLRRKNKETDDKEKVDKIMDMIVESSDVQSQTKAEIPEGNIADEITQSAQDDIKQCIFSSEILIAGENKSDLNEIRKNLINELKPTGKLESIIVDRIISSIWRLKRCLKIENQIIEHTVTCIQEYEQGFFRTRKRTTEELAQLRALKLIEDKKIEGLYKYETLLERQIYKALNELHKHRRQELKLEKKTFRKGGVKIF